MKNATDRSKLGYLLAGITGFGAVSLLGLSLPFVLPAFRRICLPYVPATDTQVKNVLNFLRKSKGSSVVDLGSGDGRIVIEAAKLGYKSVGIELNPWLVLYSKISALYAGCAYNTKFIRKDIWKTDLSKYDQVIIFGVDEMMPILENKLNKELKPDASVIACRFPFPNWTPSVVIDEGIDSVWWYQPCKEKLTG